MLSETIMKKLTAQLPWMATRKPMVVAAIDLPLHVIKVVAVV